MKRVCVLFFLIGLTAPLAADPEMAVMLELVESTQAHLAEQKQLLSRLVEFKKKRDLFVLHPTSPRLATELVLSASALSAEIDHQRLSYLFSSDFLTEIRYFSQLREEKR